VRIGRKISVQNNMSKEKSKQYIYIVQASLETASCKIGMTNDLERRLKEYNNMTGKSKKNIYQYLFCCEVSDMKQVENAIKEEFNRLREKKNREIYFFNPELYEDYVNFIKAHPLFIEEVFIEIDDTIKEIVEIEKIVKKTTPSLKSRGQTPRDVMQKAQKLKNDEFYTQYEDVVKELSMYDKNIWKDKVVFCNCDDPVDTKNEKRTSAFPLYFLRNFKELELKKLICTHYGDSKVDLFNHGIKGRIFIYIFTKDGYEEKEESPKKYTGSFDDPISLKILNEEADIVCTNPPFSRAKDFWKIVIESGKKFLILSNVTNVKNYSYIPYFMQNKVWAGYNRVDWFLDSKKQLTMAPGQWYTNIPIKDRPRYRNLKIIPLKEIPEKYKKYDDAGILLVYNSYIPSDYEIPFAVSSYAISNGLLEKGYKIVQEKRYTPYVNGKEKFARVLVQKI
jgi:predicted GIY-YIG superfamily endonuclease